MERHLQILSAGLAARGHDVQVITTAHPEGWAEEVRDGVHIHYLSPYSERRYQPAWWAASYRRFAALHAEQPFDVFCSQSAGALGYLDRLKREHRLPVVVIVHGTLWGELLTQARGARSPRGLYRLARLAWILPGHYRLWRRSVAVVDRYIAVSQQVARGWRREFNLPEEQVSLVPYGIDVTLFRPSPEKREQTRRRLGLTADQPVLATVSRLEYEKGVQFAIRALADLNDDVVLLVAGAGVYRMALDALVEQLGLTHRVRFLGFVYAEDLPDVLNAADIFLAPTLREEGLPISVIEALACGLPVIAAAAGGVPTAIEEDQNGYLIPMGDVGALAERIRRLLAHPELRQQMSATARAMAETRFSQSRMVEETEAVFLSVLAATGHEAQAAMSSTPQDMA